MTGYSPRGPIQFRKHSLPQHLCASQPTRRQANSIGKTPRSQQRTNNSQNTGPSPSPPPTTQQGTQLQLVLVPHTKQNSRGTKYQRGRIPLAGGKPLRRCNTVLVLK